MRPRKTAAGSRPPLRQLPTASALALAVFVCGCSRSDAPAQSGADPRPPSAAQRSADPADPREDAIDEAVTELIAYAEAKRAETDFAALPTWSERAGADPIALLTLGERRLGLLRAGGIVSLDADGRITATTLARPGATALREVDGALVLASESSGTLDVHDLESLSVQRSVPVAEVAAIRDVAWGEAERRLYLTDPHRHRVLSIAWPADGDGPTPTQTVEDVCRGATGIRRVGAWLVYDCLLGHRVVVRRVADDGTLGPAAAIAHDGPIWSVDVAPAGDDLLVVAGGVEDHPLDRTDGGFGYIDSFAFVYAVSGAEGTPSIVSRSTVNVSAHGVVTPKVVRWTEPGKSAAVVGFGSPRAVQLQWPSDDAEPHVSAVDLPPGSTDFAGTLVDGVFANSLLDAFVRTRPDAAPSVEAVPVVQPARTASERLGEALVFTNLMAPEGTSEGKRSRFTCETCHFEGRTDGRTHWTGRGEVHATTKTLRGLFNNRPHFSRALDRTTGKMVHAEFRVANEGTGFDPWFAIDIADQPWLRHLGVTDDTLPPTVQRRAVVDFLAIFTPDTNPAIGGAETLDATQRQGMALFARECASCHAARLVADDPSSVVAPEQWERYVLSSNGPIVWGSEQRSKTGVEPYVHPDGPRAPSLRRLWVKRPLLTNGSAGTVQDVLAAVRLGVDEVHGGGADGRPLTEDERRALGEFLDLL